MRRHHAASGSLALLSYLRDIPLEIGTATLMREPSPLCRVSIFDAIPREHEDAVVAAALADTARDRAIGCIVGMALGDALGAPLELLPAVDPPCPGAPALDVRTLRYVGAENPFRLQLGQWTDDTSMGLCLADSLIVRRGYDGSDVRARFWSWWYRGYDNAFRFDPTRSASVGLGGNVASSLAALRPGEPPPPRYEARNEDSGNGSLIRLAPVPIFHHRDADVAARVAAESSRTTHPGRIASEACAFLAWLLARVIESSDTIDPRRALDDAADAYLARLAGRAEPGVAELRALLEARQPDDSPTRNWNWRAASLDIAGTLRRRGDRFNGYPVLPGYFGSYCMDGLAVAMHAVYHGTSFGDAIERCVNGLGDADSTAAIAGQIAGAIYGYRGIDRHLLEVLRRWDDGEIALRGVLLYDLGEVLGVTGC